MRYACVAFAILVAFARPTAAQSATGEPWSISASVYTYFEPEDADYGQPTVAADHDWLHVEARFNYEDMDTGSAWFGYNFSAGSTVSLELTPMVGAVFGNTDGVAPGYKGSLQWRALDVYSETEFVIDAHNADDSFLYTWSEIGLSPLEWLRFGGVVQRTKVRDTPFDIRRGVFAGVSYKRADFGAYVFDSGEKHPTVVLSFAATF